MTCLSSCSVERLTAESKHFKGAACESILCGKGEGIQYAMSLKRIYENNSKSETVSNSPDKNVWKRFTLFIISAKNKNLLKHMT